MKRQTKTFIGNYIFIYTLGLIFVFCLWFFLSYVIGKNNFIIPTPNKTFEALGKLFKDKYLYKSIGWTLLRTFIGFGLAFIVAILLGTLAGHFKKAYLFLKPLMLVFKSIPTAALVFLFLVSAGSRFAPIYIVFLIAFPILYESIAGGMQNVPSEIKDASKIDGAGFFRNIFKVEVPLSLPYIIIGLTSSFALSIKTEIMAEIITGNTDEGLGCMIQAYRLFDPTNMAPIFAIALIALVIILFFDLIGMIVKKYISVE